MRNTAKILFISIIFFIASFQSASAQSWPPEVKPEQGRAGWKTPVHDSYDGRVLGERYTEVLFWNVGARSADPAHAKVLWTNDCAKSTVPGCSGGGTIEGTFSGGPNGIMTISGYEYTLHDGKYFEGVSGKDTFKFNVENPEIFSKYRWSMDESVPIPEIKEGKWEVETVGKARFNDLYGQVEVNIPNPDGTYDDEAWDFAKIDMELPPGTRIKTSEKSGLLLTMPNTQTDIIVGPETEIVIVEIDPEKNLTGIRSPWGKLKANVKKMLEDGSMEIEMSQAVAGIKGTVFSLEGTKDKSTINVMEGSVEFKSKATGQTEMVNAGETLSADTNGLGQKTVFDVNAENAKWDGLPVEIKRSGETKTADTGNNNYLYIIGALAVFMLAAVVLLLAKRKN